MSDHIVQVENLSRQFGSTLALEGVSLKVQPGLVYGLVGVNGAGKTTLIKHLLGLLRAKQGTVRVFGHDPVKHPDEVLRRIGYLSEERDLPEWMRIDELMRYTRAFHSGWDQAYGEELMRMFALDARKKIKHLSKGMRAQAGLIAAVAHRPELLLLDEPSTGLDAVVRKDILNAIVRTVTDEGRTVIFSSHLLDEVEQMSDYVFMVDQGKLILEGSLDEIRLKHHFLVVCFDSARDELPPFEGILSAESEFSLRGPATTWKIVCNGASERVQEEIESFGGEVTCSRGASLQEIFVARVGRDRLKS